MFLVSRLHCGLLHTVRKLLTPLLTALAHIPVRMRRPSAAREALRLSPLVQAGGANPACIECVPFVAASAKPVVVFAGRPAAKWAADARRFRLAGLLLLFKLAIHYDRMNVSTH